MKYVALCGGLGNQMFQYAYLLYLKNIFSDVKSFIPDQKWEHIGGFELNRVFSIHHSADTWEKLYNIGFPFTRLFHFFNPTYFGKNFLVQTEDLFPNKKYGYFYGTWQSEKYFINHDKIKNSFKFNEQRLNQETRRIAKSLGGEGVTVSIHIRRGDYLSDAFASGFGNCCPLEYYRKAINFMNEKFHDPLFLIFSDDMEWVKENLILRNAIYVNHNKNIDSWQDMYLMSKCKHNIIANSTFSWWGAWLNDNDDKIVIAPKRWWSTIDNDDVVPESWIRL